MSTTDQTTHTSVSMPTEQPADNFQFMSDTFTLPQDGQANATQIPISQGYSARKTDFDNQVRHRGWLGGTLDRQGYGWLLDSTNDDEDLTAEENRPLL